MKIEYFVIAVILLSAISFTVIVEIETKVVCTKEITVKEIVSATRKSSTVISENGETYNVGDAVINEQLCVQYKRIRR